MENSGKIMSFIKTTNFVEDSEVIETIRQVICPYCKSGLRNIPKWVTSMECWNCKKEFRIEQNKNKFILPNLDGKIHKTLIRGNQIL